MRGPRYSSATLYLILLGAAVAIGLIGAWVNLSASGQWIDEMFTRWVVLGDGGPDRMTDRLLTDVHPPLYYALISQYARIAGTSDAALRSFSALTGCAAILVFIFGTEKTFSLGARLFAAGVATSSGFWFYQVQNARDYALSMLLGAVILSLSLAILRDDARPKAWARWGGLAVLMTVGALTHFYMTFMSVAVLGVLFFYLPNRRVPLVLGAAGLLGLDLAYTRLLIAPFTQYSTSQSWIGNDLGWDRSVVVAAIRQTANNFSLPAVFICAAALVARRMGRLKQTRLEAALAWIREHPAWLLCGLVPLLTIAEGLASSLVLSPNLTDRNALVPSPFLWGLIALLFDGAFAGAKGRAVPAVQFAAAALVLAGASVVVGRPLPRNETFKESAAWIQSLPACKGAVIPVLQTGKKAWAKPAFTLRLEAYYHDRYLQGYAPLRVLYLDDVLAGEIPAALKPDLASRLAGQGCPVIAWSEHSLSNDDALAAGRSFVRAAGLDPASAVQLRLKGFPIYGYSFTWKKTAPAGYVLYAGNSGELALAD